MEVGFGGYYVKKKKQLEVPGRKMTRNRPKYNPQLELGIIVLSPNVL